MQPTPSNVMVTSSHMVTSLDEECTTMPVHHIDTNHKLINNGQDEAFFANNKILVNTGLHEQQPISTSQVNGDSAAVATFEMSNMTKQQVSWNRCTKFEFITRTCVCDLSIQKLDFKIISGSDGRWRRLMRRRGGMSHLGAWSDKNLTW